MDTTYKAYVLKNSTGKFYIRPWSLVWTSNPMSLSVARRLENLLKKQKGGRGFYRITRLLPPEPGS